MLLSGVVGAQNLWPNASPTSFAKPATSQVATTRLRLQGALSVPSTPAPTRAVARDRHADLMTGGYDRHGVSVVNADSKHASPRTPHASIGSSAATLV
jgi:hypothetical protein